MFNGIGREYLIYFAAMNKYFEMPANYCVDPAALPLSYRILPPEQTLGDGVRVGSAQLGQIKGVNVGVWEISGGTSTDVESDEFFLVLSGEAVVSFADGSPSLNLKPGTLGRLRAGTETTWTVTKTLRKIYIA